MSKIRDGASMQREINRSTAEERNRVAEREAKKIREILQGQRGFTEEEKEAHRKLTKEQSTVIRKVY